MRHETDAVTARELGDDPEPGDHLVSPYPDEPVASNGLGDRADVGDELDDDPGEDLGGDAEDGAPVDASVSVYPDRDPAPAAHAGASEEDLFAGDPEDYELGFGAGLAPREGPVQGDVLVFDEPPAVEAYRPRPMSRAERRRRVRLQARRVRRIIRHVEPWSVLKISLFFYACLWVILLVAGFMIWGVADSSGTIDRLESLIVELFSLDEFTIDASQVFRGYALAGLALAIAGTTFNVLMCLLFNLISDLTGGLRVTMIEEETARPAPPRRVRRRRPPVRR